MTNVGALSYKVSANVAGFKDGMTLSRSELAMTRRAMSDSRTDAEKLGTKLDVLEKAYKAGQLTQEQYDKVVASVNAKSKEAIAEEKRKAEVLKEANEITRRLMTSEERLADERAKLLALKPHVSAETYARALEQIDAKMPGAIANEQRLERQKRLLNDAMQEGKRVTQSVENATERYAREIRELDRLLRRGAISQQTYDRSAANSRASLNNARSAIAGNIPVVGNLSSQLMQGAARFGPYGVAAVAAIAGLYAFAKAVKFVADGVAASMETYDRQHEAASQLMVDLERFQVLILAGDRASSATEEQVGSMLTKLQLNVAKAAQGNAKLRESIQGMGLDVDQLSKKDATLIFRDVSTAIAGMKSPGDQMKAIFDLVGKEGMKMADTFRLGADGLDRMNQLAGETGRKMSEMDAQQLAAAKDAIDDMKDSFGALWDSLAVELAPAIQMTAQGLQRGVQYVGRFIDGMTGLVDVGYYAVGVMTDFGNVLIGINNLDFDRIASGLTGEATSKILTERDAIVAKNKADGEALRIRKEQQAAINANIEAAAEEQSNEISKRQKALEGVQQEIAALKAKNLELIHGKEVIERQRILALEVPDALKRELIMQQQINKEIARKTEIRDRDRKAAEDSAKRQKETIKSQAEQIVESLKTPFDKLAEEIAGIRRLRSVGAIDQRTAQQAEIAARKRLAENDRRETPSAPPSAQRGSAEAYKLIADNARNARGEAEKKHRELMRDRELTRQIAERVAVAVEKLETTGGV